MRRRTWLFGLAACACAQGRREPQATPTPRPPARPETPRPPAEPSPDGFALRGANVTGVGPADLEVRQGRITAIGRAARELPAVAAEGRWIAPTCVDSHVHLSYWPVARDLLAAGIGAAIDLAAPLSALRDEAAAAGLELRGSGPMLTARGGYPTRGWGEDGYGLEVSRPEDGVRAVDALLAAGAQVIKVPIDEGPALDAKTLAAIVARAHARGVKVVAHALMDREARRAAELGIDALAHTPVEPLPAATVKAWSGRAVISTLAAFGGARETVENLRRLRAGGATVLYGTDLGNRRVPGIDAGELELLAQAGLDGAAVLAAMTAAPRRYWGLTAGALEVGGAASFLVLGRDPTLAPETLAEPLAVYASGVRLSGGT